MQTGNDVVIDTFRSGDQQAFDALNRAWLTAYGLLEAPDERQLADPVGQIVEPGGQIFVARRSGEVVGSCAVLPHHEGVLELVKLAVAPVAQGLGLGRRLVEACLAYARAQGARRLVLLSSSKLDAALRLYEGLGFRRAAMPADAAYVTADVYMELDLRAPPTTLKSAAPTFVVSDVGATARWYAEHLGFHTAGAVPAQEPYVYASVQRDGVELMLLRLPGYRKPDLGPQRPEGVWDAYIRMDGVHAFYEAVRGDPFVVMPLKQQPYGDWEFEVRDPNGYVLVFGGC